MTSSILMNKEMSKKIFISLGVQTPPTITLDKIKKKANFPNYS